MLVMALALGSCSNPRLRIDRQTDDQVSICRDTETADFQEAEDMAAEFCGRMKLLPRLAGTDRCTRHAVRYNYICVAPHY
jgi:hypothetical protein